MIYHVSFTRYCVLIECYRPIRLFIVILMSNNIYYLLLDRGEPPSLHPCYKEGVNGVNHNFLVS